MDASPAVRPWSGRPAWCVLDCAFGKGEHLLDLWAQWRAQPERPGMLHYTGIAQGFDCVDSEDPFQQALAAACRGLPAGFHRIALADGRLSLTLCIGPAADMLAAQDFQADEILLASDALAADRWAVKALARCCRRGTRLAMAGTAPESFPAAWADAGFKPWTESWTEPMTCHGMQGFAVFEPAWALKRTRKTDHRWNHPAGQCAVVGAGLAGASVARALALRGWQVTVLDSAPHPAGGASGLPVGLVVPHISADDSPRSRLSRAGARLTLAQARSHLQADTDWAPSGVCEMRMNPATNTREPHWHALAGWIKPASMVQAWLETPGITFVGSTSIAQLERGDTGWRLLDAIGHTVTSADIVVLANALGCRALLQGLPLPTAMAGHLAALHAMHGTMTMGCIGSGLAFPATPVNGLGSFAPRVPSDAGDFWAAGATFEPDPAALKNVTQQHTANLYRLQGVLPDVAKAVAPQVQNGEVWAWSGERCVTHDRLPWVGCVDLATPGLWVCAGMGSRGLSFAALCAELLAARLGGEPLPLEANLVRSLEINRLTERTGCA